MTTKEEIIQTLQRVVDDISAVVSYIAGEPEPPQPPQPPPDLRPKGWVVVKVPKCHLRAVDHLDSAGKKVWRSEPKRTLNPRRDRYLIYLNMRVQVYLDGDIIFGKFAGAWRGAGMNHGWEVVPGQVFNGHLVTSLPKLYLLCRDTSLVVA